MPLSRPARMVIAIAGLSFAVIALAYGLAPTDPWTRAWVANLSWTWTSLFATVCCGYAGKRVAGAHERNAWRWLAAGCLSFLLGQIVWSYYELVRRVQPPYPSLADIAYLGLYACIIVAVVQMGRAHRRGRRDLDIGIDAALVTFTVASLTYEFVVEPVLDAGGGLLPVITSVAWSIGGIAILWTILMQMLYRTRFPRATSGLVLPAILVLCAGNVIYAVAALRGSYRSGGLLDLAWDATFVLIAAAAAIAPGETDPGDAAPLEFPGLAPRAAALTIGLAGTTVTSVWGALAAGRERDLAYLTVVGMAIIATRVLYSLRAGRRYADMLEREVAAQTRTLMDSLSATGAAERSLRVVMEAVPDAITVLDRDGHPLEMNAAAAELVGLPREAVPGRSIFEFLEAEAVAVTRENLDAAFEGDVRRFEVPFVRADQTRGISSMLYAPVREAGRVIKVLALSRDVTDLRHAEAQLQQAEKLAAMGQLVSGVAHEINNPAAIISGFAQTMMLDDVKPEHREMMKMIYDEATRIGRITQNLLAFARAGSKERTLVDVNDVVQRTFALRSYHLSTLNIDAQLDLTHTDPKVWGNSSELQQMLLNLIINAEQALMTVDTPRALTLRTAGSDHAVTIACIDTGPGIPPEIRERIFDPFFTTKPEGVGTGLGLSICYGIIHDHGGRLSVESETGRGTTFVATLPRDPRTQRRASLETHRVVEEAGPLAVLLVDDEAGLRKAVARFLNRRGLQCRAVGDGAEALEVLRFNDYDVIISDVRMAGMNGRDLLERLRADRPDLVPRLIFSTGDTFASETATLLKESGVPYLLKPFDFARLEALVREVAAKVSA